MNDINMNNLVLLAREIVHQKQLEKNVAVNLGAEGSVEIVSFANPRTIRVKKNSDKSSTRWIVLKKTPEGEEIYHCTSVLHLLKTLINEI
jgi:hypothetical protein